MKIKEGFMLREIAGIWVVVPLGKRVVEFNGIISLNEIGVLIWKQLEERVSQKQIVSKIISEYNIDEETAKKDLNDFLRDSIEKGIIEE